MVARKIRDSFDMAAALDEAERDLFRQSGLKKIAR
jgi:hypothetical protein